MIVIENLSSNKVHKSIKVAAICGITSQVVALSVLTGASIANSPWFDWTKEHISALGVEGSTKMFFNTGMMLVGILGLIFAVGLGQILSSGRLGQIAVVSLLLGSFSLFIMGAFPRTFDFLHAMSAITFYVFITLALFFMGAVAISTDQVKWGVVSVAGGILISVPQLIIGPLSGGAVLQLASFLPWSVWTVAVGVSLLMNLLPLESDK
ncbi:DUF998 domain-containing protein [Chloroflexota bacterium]